MNPDLGLLQPYPFEKLAKLKAGVTPPAHLEHIALSIGEPKHAPPGFVVEELIHHLHGLANYPLTRGSDALREAVAGWLLRRFKAKVDPATQILPVSGTREALFSFAQCVVNRADKPLVLMPNPFYQIYEGAAYLAGATPWFYPTPAENGFLPDFDAIPAEVWRRCQLIYVCSPGNPTGAVLPEAAYRRLIELADEHDFIIASDECYSELYYDAPPVGLLQVCANLGRDDFARCVVFHSLSKRSNLPGLRSGFVAGDAVILKGYHLYRTYHGCTLPPPTQTASVAAWRDEAHVEKNRALYLQKFTKAIEILGDVLDVSMPEGAFYLWAKTPISDTEFARRLFAEQNVTVLPGSYLSREVDGHNPGAGYVRMALVAEMDECAEAAERIRHFIQTL
ncbi:succinyldiaminopimelate transaminase [Thiofaba sp. EF100]|jgi:N-succinyldiaminopimelate aminotransferase|uniref:succinyldiaminopimelate transaminase n=1 Tax=Thiofaba sp. EF100 TaxID=3121274 RepID=UPI0032215B9E